MRIKDPEVRAFVVAAIKQMKTELDSLIESGSPPSDRRLEAMTDATLYRLAKRWQSLIRRGQRLLWT